MKPPKKKFLYINRKAPYGSIYGLEALDIVLASTAFDLEVNVAFLDDGVFQLKCGQDPLVLQMKHYTRTFGALFDFGVESVFVEKESLDARGMKTEDLVQIPLEDGTDGLKIVSSQKLKEIVCNHDVVIQF